MAEEKKEEELQEGAQDLTKELLANLTKEMEDSYNHIDDLGRETIEPEAQEEKPEEEKSKEESDKEQEPEGEPDAVAAEEENSGKQGKKFPKWAKVLSIVAGVIVVLALAVVIGFHYLYNQMNIDKGGDVEVLEEEFDKDEGIENLEEIHPDEINVDANVSVRKEDDVINILLCGEEKIGEDRGRTDSIMIATINQKENSLRLTSIMRDTYVEIPGYSSNKINSAYHTAGIPLLKKTISENFGIDVDGYVLVNFDSFEEVIDALGGIEITLSEEEASYLNRTNYISEYYNRNVSAGTQTMNGNQALGYARVRYVGKDGVVGDFARTLRHRTVIQAIFEKYKEKSTLDLLAMVPKILPLVTTDLSKKECIEYLTAGIEVKNKNPEIETLNVPVEGAYKITRVGTMSVILPSDLQTNVDAMHEFIFGSAEEKKDGEDKKNKDSSEEKANITVGQ